MPEDASVWFHITFTLHGHWLPGDPRGFRSRNHRIHSSGDHRNPPPPGEHAGLHRHAASNTTPSPPLTTNERRLVGEELRAAAAANSAQLAGLAVAPNHVHLVVELASNGLGRTLGEWKRRASIASRRPGRLWGRGYGVKRIRDRRHQLAAVRYVLRHAEHDAWVWSPGLKRVENG